MPRRKETPLGQPASPGGETAPSSIELPVADNLIAKLWATPIVKEFVLMLMATIGLQVATGLLDLSGRLDGVQDLSVLYTTVEGWMGQFINAVILTAFKQSLAFFVARLAGTKL